MMRQAGRHMKVRCSWSWLLSLFVFLRRPIESWRRNIRTSETGVRIQILPQKSGDTVHISVPFVISSNSLQPWLQYKTDGVILFSDILTPLPGMGVDFQIENNGPKLGDWTAPESLKKLKDLDPYQSTPFVGQTLRNLRREVGNEATVLGFVGAPFTLASYMIEGGSSDDFAATKKMMYSSPDTLHKLLSHLAENIATYASYQIRHGAQVIQLFDSWAGTLSPLDYDTFALPYQQRIISKIKQDHPKVPVIIFAAKSGAIIERLVQSGAHCISLDWTTSIREIRERIKSPRLVLQGNLDPLVLLGPKEVIKDRTNRILNEGHRKRKSPIKRHIMNLGHGVHTETPEENVQYFVDLVKEYRAPKRIRLRPADYEADEVDENQDEDVDSDDEDFE